jgi:hypothetical protein
MNQEHSASVDIHEPSDNLGDFPGDFPTPGPSIFGDPEWEARATRQAAIGFVLQLGMSLNPTLLVDLARVVEKYINEG